MKDTWSKLNSQRIVVNFLQQLVTECTDHVPVTEPCTVAATTDYSVPTSYTALYSYPTTGYSVPATQPCAVVSITGNRVYQPSTGYTACTEQLPSFSRLQSLPAYYQPAPRIINSKVFYQLTTPHQQPIHRPKTDDRPNNV